MANSEVAVATHLDVFSSGVCWSAVIGGAFVAAAVSLIMLALGAGFELSAISPWSNAGASAATVGTVALIWIIATQIVASTLGGYLTGRLRTRWQAIHNDEVHFRDTANGFLAWAVSLVVAAAFLGSAASAMAGRASAAREGARIAEQSEAVFADTYVVDRLFRSDHLASEIDAAARAEAGRVIAHDLQNKADRSADLAYLAQLVSAKTGLNASDASKRISEAMTEARQTAEDLRRATARILLWTFLALIIGAFCASFAATMGGRQRDHVQLI